MHGFRPKWCVILWNLFLSLYGKSLGSISTWSSEGLLCIPCYNYSILVSPESGGGLHIKKPCLMVTCIMCPSNWVKWPVINWSFLNHSSSVKVTYSPLSQQESVHSSRLSYNWIALRCRGINDSIYSPDIKPSVISPIDNSSVPCPIMHIPVAQMTYILKYPSIYIL